MNKEIPLLDLIKSIEDHYNFNSIHGNIEFEGIIQQVLHILDDAIAKIKVSLIVPFILADEKLIQECLSPDEYTELSTLYNEYQQFSHENVNISLTEQIDKFVDFRLIKTVEMIYENRKVRNLVDTLIDSITDTDQDLITTLDELRRIAAIRIKTTATAELAREKIVHDIYHDNQKSKQSIIDLKKQLHEKEIYLKWKLTSKHAVIHEYKDALKAKNWESNTKMKKEISMANEKLMEICSASLQRQSRLQEETEKLKASYDAIVRNNIIADKKSREFKNRHMLQLHGLVRKYDTEIGNKIKENEALQSELAAQQKILADFMVGFNAVEEEYNRIMQIKYEEERSAFEQKLLLFMMTRAAKIIQRAWRKYRKSKRKGRGGKGKGKGKGKKK